MASQTCDTSAITVASTSSYSQVVWTPAAISIAWPSFTISPADCFGISDIEFRDSTGTDLLASGLFAVDWVAKTLTFNTKLGCVDAVTMFTTFNTITPFRDSGVALTFDCAPYFCPLTTISPQTFATPTPYQMVFSQPNPATVLQFKMHSDSYGASQSSPLVCGQKSYSTDKTWLTVVAPSDPLTQPFLIRADTNSLALVGSQSVVLTVGF